MWTPATQFHWENFPSAYADWLQNPGSLTQRFRELSEGKLRHQLFFAGWKSLSELELEPLSSTETLSDKNCWTREIVFYGNTVPWEWARTIIPKTSLVDEGEAFIHLGNKPIGDVLFSDPNLKRSEFEIARLGPEDSYTKEVNALLNSENDQIWARRSLIYFHQKPLLIYELFLPAVFEAIHLESSSL